MDISPVLECKTENSLPIDLEQNPPSVLESQSYRNQVSQLNESNINNEPSQINDTNKALLIMNINIGDGKKYSLSVMEGDDPFDLARNFCKKHNLEDNVVEALAQNIYDNMEQVLQDTVSTMQPSYRQSVSPRLQDSSPFRNRPIEFLEPEHREDHLKTCSDMGETEPFEQIERQFFEEANTQQTTLGMINNQEVHPSYIENLRQETAKLHDSTHADGSAVNTTIKLSELISDENKMSTDCVLADVNTRKEAAQEHLRVDLEEDLDDSFDVNERYE